MAPDSQMARIEWAMWANEQAIISCVLLCIGSIAGICSFFLEEFPHVRWQLSIYSMIISVLIFIFEYPRGNRIKQGNNIPRLYQGCASHIVLYLGQFGKNYFIRFLFYLVLCIPSLLQLATLLGGLGIVITALIYLKAALEGESWTPCVLKLTRTKSLTRPGPPVMAPPRHKRLTLKVRKPDSVTVNYSNIEITDG